MTLYLITPVQKLFTIDYESIICLALIIHEYKYFVGNNCISIYSSMSKLINTLSISFVLGLYSELLDMFCYEATAILIRVIDEVIT